MKSYQFQKVTKKLLPYVLICGMILLFTLGSPLSGTDLSLVSRMGEGGTDFWLREAGASGGNYLSASLRAIMADIPVLRHVLFAVMLSAALIALVHFGGAERTYMYFVILFLGLAAPKAIFAHSFAGISGGATVLIPAFLTVMLLFTVSDLFVYKGNKKAWKIPFLFLNGFVSQLFSESIGITLLLISLVSLILLWREYRFSWHLAAHSFGCILGLTLSLILSGSADAIADSFYVMVDQCARALDLLFVENLLLMGVLTLACLMLIRPIRTERSKNCNITLALLLIPMGLFLLLNVANSALAAFVGLYRIMTVVKLVAAFVYCLGVLRTVQHYVSKPFIIHRTSGILIALGLFVLMYTVTGTVQPSMLYIPYLLMVALTVLLLGYSFRHYGKMDKILEKPLLLAAIGGYLALTCISFANGTYYGAVDTHIQDCLKAGTVEITLPKAPYEEYLTPTDRDALAEYYNFSAYGEVKIDYVPFADWDWHTYYEAHNVPVIEEYDEDAAITEGWDHEFEEDE